MLEYLDFLKPFEVRVNLNLERYLEKANLTSKDQKYLQEHLDALSLTHRIPFGEKDEFMVFSATMSKWDNQYTETRVVTIIATSLPYDCMIALHYAKATRFHIFTKRPNKKNAGKGMVEEHVISPTVILDRLNENDVMVQDLLQRAFGGSNSSAQLYSVLKEGFQFLYQKKKDNHWAKLRELGYVQEDDGEEYLTHPEEWRVKWEVIDSLKKLDTSTAWENDDWETMFDN